MKRKLILTVSVLFFLGVSVYGQVYKYRAKECAIKTKDSYNRWTDWSDWQTCDILTVINFDKSKVTIYSKETQEFDVVETYPKEYNDKGEVVFKLFVIDRNGLRCNIRQVFVKSNTYHSQLYIDYSDVMYVYNLVSN